jgi:hypothetical protein
MTGSLGSEPSITQFGLTGDRLSECGKFQKRLAARRASRTVPETTVLATILTRLCVAIDSVEDT